MNHYCRSRYDLMAILKTLGAGRAQLRKLIVGQWLMVLALSAVTGGAIGLLFENVLMVLLKPVLPAALPPASLWPWLWALGTMTVISLLVASPIFIAHGAVFGQRQNLLCCYKTGP